MVPDVRTHWLDTCQTLELKENILSETEREALRLIREAGNNTTDWATWAQKMAAWGMEPNKWPKPSDYAPEEKLANNESSGVTWRQLALQFDGHCMQALYHIRALLADYNTHAPIATEFLNAPPLSGEAVLAQRLSQMVDDVNGSEVSKVREGGYCSEGDHCVCGGDLPSIREGCSNWCKRT